MLFGVDLAAQDAARRENHHPCELRSELGERLVVELLRFFAAALADAVRLRLRLGADIPRGGLGCLGHSVGDRLRVTARVREETLDLGLEVLAIGLRLLRQREALADPACAGREHRRDRTPEQSPHEVEEQEKVHDRDQHPERMHGRNEDPFL